MILFRECFYFDASEVIFKQILHYKFVDFSFNKKNNSFFIALRYMIFKYKDNYIFIESTKIRIKLFQNSYLIQILVLTHKNYFFIIFVVILYFRGDTCSTAFKWVIKTLSVSITILFNTHLFSLVSSIIKKCHQLKYSWRRHLETWNCQQKTSTILHLRYQLLTLITFS